jgi:polysaccharide deacetylase family protein (PEP-CTERM system associated)
MLNCITIDVEDWFCVESFREIFPVETWNNQKPRVLSNVVRICEILDEYNVKATFFVLGWIAERFPEITEYLHSKGHEIGSHSYSHGLIHKMSPQEFREDTIRSLEAINAGADISIRGYRAPSFSIDPKDEWVWKILVDLGFSYDSSVFPVVHDIYGSPDAPRFAHVIKVDESRSILEIPPSTVRIFGKNIGVAGGGYLRLFPYWYTSSVLKKLNRMGFPGVVYFHPWELDPKQPRIKARARSRLRHYTNLRTTEIKLRKLLKNFKFGPVRDVFDLDMKKQIGNKL